MHDYFIENGCSHKHKLELPSYAGIASGALVLFIIVIAVIAVLICTTRVSVVIVAINLFIHRIYYFEILCALKI